MSNKICRKAKEPPSLPPEDDPTQNAENSLHDAGLPSANVDPFSGVEGDVTAAHLGQRWRERTSATSKTRPQLYLCPV